MLQGTIRNVRELDNRLQMIVLHVVFFLFSAGHSMGHPCCMACIFDRRFNLRFDFYKIRQALLT